MIGDLVSSCPHNTRENFMPGVGEIKLILKLDQTEKLYICEHNDKYYMYTEEQIYLYDPY
jgi:hypothetical protein